MYYNSMLLVSLPLQSLIIQMQQCHYGRHVNTSIFGFAGDFGKRQLVRVAVWALFLCARLARRPAGCNRLRFINTGTRAARATHGQQNFGCCFG
jgi:hypothetical protein